MPSTTELSTGTLRSFLRNETADLHAAVERAFDLTRPGISRNDYCATLITFWEILVPLESSIRAITDRELPGYYPRRMRTTMLARDLKCFGIRCDAIRLRTDIPEILDLPSALGALYVIEGSTLGGQVISRHLERTLGITPEQGGAFFAGYGAETESLWREYLDLLESHATEENRPQILYTAREVFQCFLRGALPV